MIAVSIALLPASLAEGAKSIFDDDWTPPPRSEPAAPAPATRPAPALRKPAPPPTGVPTIARPGERPATPVLPSVAPAPAISSAGQLARQPVPAAAEQAKSRKLMSEAFAKELADSSPAARRALARKLLEEAAKLSNAPSDQFVVLGGAIQSALEAADLPLALEAADQMSDTFDLDGLAVKASVALKLLPKSYAANAANVPAGLGLLDPLESAEDFTAASRLVTILEQVPAVDPSVRVALPKHAREIEELRTARERLTPSLEKLRSFPDDPAANLAVGRYTALLRGDWEHGLPLLAKGSDPKLAALAKAALADPADADARTKLAEEWWDLAQAASGRAKSSLLAEAMEDYRLALPGLSGLGRVLAEKRVAEAEAVVGTATRPVARVAPAGLLPGLVAELYLDTDFSRPVMKRIDRQISFEWQNGPPDSDMLGERFSIRWAGALRVPRTGTYTFFASVDDDVDVWIDGQSVLTQHGPTRSAQAEAKLSGGMHAVRIDYRNVAGEGRLMLQWSEENGFAQQSLGRDALWHDAAAGADAAPAPPGWRSDLISGIHGGEPFREDAPAHYMLVGFELTMHNNENADVIKSARAIYRGPSGEFLGKQFGEPNGEVTRLVAKPGYAVGIIQAHAGSHVDGFSLHFMRLQGETLIAADAYDSPSFGGPGGDEINVGEGKPVIGIYGIAGGNLDGLGMVTADGAAPSQAAVTASHWPAAPVHVTIISADYGNDNGTVSLAKAIQAALDADPFMPIDAGNGWAGDPAPGSGKTLTLSYQVGEKTCDAGVSEDHICFLPPIPQGGAAVAGASVPFRIIAVRYGADNAWVDATEAIRAEVVDPSKPFTVRNMAGGKDLRFGKEKRLVVYFETQGRRYVRITREGSEMTLMP